MIKAVYGNKILISFLFYFFEKLKEILYYLPTGTGVTVGHMGMIIIGNGVIQIMVVHAKNKSVLRNVQVVLLD